MGIQGKLWRVIRNIYSVNQGCVYLDGVKSEFFNISGLLLVDDFVGLSEKRLVVKLYGVI